MTSAIGMQCAPSHAASSAAPGIRLSVRRPSDSISSTTVLACLSARHFADRMSSPRGTPALRYISTKSKFGTVSVPSMSNTTPRKNGGADAAAAAAAAGILVDNKRRRRSERGRIKLPTPCNLRIQRMHALQLSDAARALPCVLVLRTPRWCRNERHCCHAMCLAWSRRADRRAAERRRVRSYGAYTHVPNVWLSGLGVRDDEFLCAQFGGSLATAPTFGRWMGRWLGRPSQLLLPPRYTFPYA